MQEALDNHKEFIEETILKRICIDNFGNDWGDYFLTIKESLWEAFKAGREYQFKLSNK